MYFLHRLKMIQVVGKRSRPVPILIPECIQEAMDVLMKFRRQAGILSENKYFFTLPKTPSSHLNSYNTFKRIGSQANLKEPGFLTTTRMRKGISSMAQVKN